MWRLTLQGNVSFSLQNRGSELGCAKNGHSPCTRLAAASEVRFNTCGLTQDRES